MLKSNPTRDTIKLNAHNKHASFQLSAQQKKTAQPRVVWEGNYLRTTYYSWSPCGWLKEQFARLQPVPYRHSVPPPPLPELGRPPPPPEATAAAAIAASAGGCGGRTPSPPTPIEPPLGTPILTAGELVLDCRSKTREGGVGFRASQASRLGRGGGKGRGAASCWHTAHQWGASTGQGPGPGPPHRKRQVRSSPPLLFPKNTTTNEEKKGGRGTWLLLQEGKNTCTHIFHYQSTHLHHQHATIFLGSHDIRGDLAAATFEVLLLNAARALSHRLADLGSAAVHVPLLKRRK